MASKNKLFEFLIGSLVAIFFIIGRWGILRLSTNESNNAITEPRYWIGFIMMIFLLMPIKGEKSKNIQFNKALNSITIFIIIFLTYMIVTSFWAPDTFASTKKAYEQFLTIIVILALHRWIMLTDLEYIRSVFWGGMFFSCFFLASFALTSLFRDSFATYRISVLGGGPNVFGRNMGFLCLASLLIGFNTRKWIFSFIVSLISFYLVILSGSRNALIATVISLIVCVLLYKIKITRLIVSISIIATIGLLVLIYTPFGRAINNSFQYRFINLLLEQNYTSGRSNIYEEAIEIAQQYPIFGTGLSGFSTMTTSAYTHNLELEALTEGGIVGFSLIVLLIVFYLRQIWINRAFVHKVTVAACILALIFSQFSGDLFDSRTVFIFMILSFNKE